MDNNRIESPASPADLSRAFSHTCSRLGYTRHTNTFASRPSLSHPISRCNNVIRVLTSRPHVVIIRASWSGKFARDVGWLTEMSLGISTKAEFASNNWLAANAMTIRRRHDSLMDRQLIGIVPQSRHFAKSSLPCLRGKKMRPLTKYNFDIATKLEDILWSIFSDFFI